MTAITLPRRSRGRQSAVAEAAYQRDLATFCNALLEFRSRLDFEVSARGWGYYLEGQGAIAKGDIDLVEKLINECRKSGDLPLDICAVDDNRAFENLEQLDTPDIEDRADSIVNYMWRAHQLYEPVSFWDNQPYYVQMVVEKIDLKSLFRDLTSEFHVPIANAKGWGDLHIRAGMMRRFQEQERYYDQKCVLLYCGDFDPGGLQISGFLRSNMADLSKVVGWSPDNLIIDRFGLNEDYIAGHDLIWIENLITGSGKDLSSPSHPDHSKSYVQEYIAKHGARKVEANALLNDPEAARDLCRDAILKYVDLDLADQYHREIADRREDLRLAIVRRMEATP